MKRPSERALDLADAVLDHARHGLTRLDALYELAEMIDEHNAELLAAIRQLLVDATRCGGSPGPDAVAELETVARDYQPLRPAMEEQSELFAAPGPPARLL